MMRIANLLGCCLLVDGLFHSVRITKYKEGEDCKAPLACSKLTEKDGSMRDLWECWAEAPSRCWYMARIWMDKEVPQDAICKSISNDYVIDLSGYKPGFVRSGPTAGAMLFSMPKEHRGCDFWVKSGHYAGDDARSINACPVRRIIDEATMPLYLTEWNRPRQLVAEGSLANFIMSQPNLLIVQGVNETCGGTIDRIYFDGLFREVLFHGIVGNYTMPDIPTPTPTMPPPSTTTTEIILSDLSPIELCEHVIYPTSKNVGLQWCRAFCSKVKENRCVFGRSPTAEEWVQCAVDDSHRSCYDQRYQRPEPYRKKVAASEVKRSAAVPSMRSISWVPPTCPPSLMA